LINKVIQIKLAIDTKGYPDIVITEKDKKPTGNPGRVE